jgi:serine/threonine-protein phosphatase 2A regulatory subunit A
MRLSKADWFTSKISATGLYQTPYTRATPPSQEALRQHYGQLVHDDTPMVRRQAANNLAKFIKAMPAAIVIDEMIPLFQHLAADDQDSVRLLTVDILIAIAEAVPKEQQSSHGVLLTALRSLFEDKSWRVRYMVADRFEKVCSWYIWNMTQANMGVDCQSRRRGGCQPRPCTRIRKAPERHRGRGSQRDRRANSRYGCSRI